MTHSSHGATQTLAQFCSRLTYDAIPRSAVEMARNLLLDGLACLVVGTRGGPGKSAAATVKRLGGHPQCTIFTGGFKGSVRDAAFANSIALYSVGLNDIHKPSTSHPGGCIVMPVLAAGEWLERDGKDILTAMVAGYEVNGRLGTATAPSHRERGFHTTGTIGTFGATAAVGRMMGADPAALASAFGIAGSQAAGLYEFHHDGTLTMIFHAGRAGQNGVEANLLVQDGLSGPATVMEGSKGFCKATADQFDETVLTQDLGERFLIEETSFRLYYGCSSTLAASGATEEILRGLSNEARIAEIEVRCHPVVFRDNNEVNPSTLLAARLSMQYNIALILHRGSVLRGDLGEEELWDPDIRRHLPQVRLIADESMPRFGAAVRARLEDGRIEERAIMAPVGDAASPPSFSDVAEKFRRMAGPIGESSAVERVIGLVENLEANSCLDLTSAISDACRAAVH